MFFASMFMSIHDVDALTATVLSRARFASVFNSMSQQYASSLLARR